MRRHDSRLLPPRRRAKNALHYVLQSVMSGQVQAGSLPGQSSDVLLRVAFLKGCAERAHSPTASKHWGDHTLPIRVFEPARVKIPPALTPPTLTPGTRLGPHEILSRSWRGRSVQWLARRSRSASPNYTVL